jgi:ATP-dependent RNA helicase DDX47/RRP3
LTEIISIIITFIGCSIGVKCVVIVGGMDMMTQALLLAKKPHIIIATPGRLVDHLENTKGFNLRSLKILVILLKFIITIMYLRINFNFR